MVSPVSQWDFREPVRRPATCTVLKREAPFCWVLFAIYNAIAALSRTLSPASHHRLGLSVLFYHFTKGDLKKAVPGSWLSQGSKVTTWQESQSFKPCLSVSRDQKREACCPRPWGLSQKEPILLLPFQVTGLSLHRETRVRGWDFPACLRRTVRALLVPAATW